MTPKALDCGKHCRSGAGAEPPLFQNLHALPIQSGNACRSPRAFGVTHARPRRENPVFPGEQRVETFRKKILKWGGASAVISGSKPEAWRSSVPHDQVVVSKLRKNCVVK